MDENKRLYSAVTVMSPAIYKEFYRAYYKDRYKTFIWVSTLISIIAAFAALYMFFNAKNPIWCLIPMWICGFMLIYPRNMYKKPYKRSRNTAVTTHFAFYEYEATEKTNSKKSSYKYTDLSKIIETSNHFVIIHNDENASVVDKSSLDGDVKVFSQFLRTRAPYKKVK